MNRLLSRLLCCSGVVLAAAHSSAQTLPTYVPTDGLVGWWPFNGNANDESGNGHHGAVHGAELISDRFGATHSAYMFNNSEITVQMSTESFSGDYSISVWIHMNPDDTLWPTFLLANSVPSGWADPNALVFQFDNGLDRFVYYMQIAPGNAGVTLNQSNTANYNEWYNLVISCSSETCTFYVNGALDNTAGPIFLSTFGSFLHIGNGRGSGEIFLGFLDDIGIWNRALTAEEVMALYLAAPPEAGCTDATACNFNPEANVNDGSCVASGCLEPAACNFNPSASCAGEACDYSCCPGPGCCGIGTVWDAEAGVCVPWAACPDVIYNPDFNSDGMITVADLLALLAIFEDVDSDGDGIFDSMDDCFGVYDGCGVCGGVGVDADDDGICDDVDPCVGTTDVVGVCGGSCTADADADGVCDTSDPCVGAFDACGVCNGPGAVYMCGCADIPAGDCDCASNQLDALGLCGGSCASDADADGTCDDADPCVGALDVCGVCNGPGPSVPVIDQIIFVTDSIYVPPLASWYVFTYATDTLYTYVCPVLGCTDSSATNFNPAAAIDDSSCIYGPVQCGGLSTVTFDGHTYALVGIGTQCWFAENLRSDSFRNGDPIPNNLDNMQWAVTTAGACTVYGEGNIGVYDGSNDEDANLAVYGRLYNWFAVVDSRELCPNGFHVPSDSEWSALEIAVGGSIVGGAALKATPPQWDGVNAAGFAALPGGYRYNPYHGGNFFNQGTIGYWWTSSAVGVNAWLRNLSSGSNVVTRDSVTHYSTNSGLSVRCLRD